MPKVTYLIGAGASKNCLPMIKDVPVRLEALYHFFTNNPPLSDNTPTSLVNERLHLEITKECEDLRNKTLLHSSIDTYAKKLFVTDSEKYLKLKVILSFLFIWDQTTRPTDPRYDTFFASIIGKHSSDLKGDIRIVSWNYDYQFEKAYSQYSGSHSLESNQNKLNVTPSSEHRIKQGMPDLFSIYKLNGTTGFHGPSNTGITNVSDDLSIKSAEGLVLKFLDHYHKTINKKDFGSLLTFAWERDDNKVSKMVVQNAIANIQKSAALVVIGYSFPFFNRDVDKEIMRALTSVGRIYIQDPAYSNIASNILSVIPADPVSWQRRFQEVGNCDQFYLPAEL